MSRTEEIYVPALEGKRIPVLTLDNKWHQLFHKTGRTTPQIEALSEQLNDLLKQQGKANTQLKNLKLYKKKLMDEVVELSGAASEDSDDDKVKELEEHRRLLQECNEKIEEYQDAGLDLPKQIAEVNKKLMLSTMELCYEMIQTNTREITQITDWINEMRVELKKQVVKKQDKLLWNQNLYAYMHDIFGSDVIELFDMKYFKDNFMKSSGTGES